jgi:tight adherence protein C
MTLVAILAVVLLAGAVGVAVSVAREPRLRRSQYLEQIEAYGYTAHAKPIAEPKQHARKALDTFASSIGSAAARRLRGLREEEIQRELVSAGYYGIGARRFLGYRMLLGVIGPVVTIWLLVLLGSSTLFLFAGGVAGLVVGWVGPSFIIHRRVRVRLQTIDDSLPELIDLLVVTLEAGVSFAGALRMSAERLEGPLGDEIKLTIQEQSLGLATMVALDNWLKRCETPSVRSFVRAMVQGDRLGVSIGQILRNLAVEMRARRKQVIEERAQKAPIKILFPLVFLIFPAMFVIILGPALFSITSVLK